MASPPQSPAGILVPYGGSNCAKCMYQSPIDPSRCINKGYVAIAYKGKKAGDDRFIDGKTGLIVEDPNEFCCNLFDWDYT